MDAGTKLRATDEDITELTAPTSNDQDLITQTPPPDTEWLNYPRHTAPTPQRNRRVDVSIDTKLFPHKVYE
jgi:hypothetical protein